jgi:hypothetical protein
MQDGILSLCGMGILPMSITGVPPVSGCGMGILPMPDSEHEEQQKQQQDMAKMAMLHMGKMPMILTGETPVLRVQ